MVSAFGVSCLLHSYFMTPDHVVASHAHRPKFQFCQCKCKPSSNETNLNLPNTSSRDDIARAVKPYRV